MPPTDRDERPRHDLDRARRAVLVQRPLHWQVAASLIAALERAWAELDARPLAPSPTSDPIDPVPSAVGPAAAQRLPPKQLATHATSSEGHATFSGTEAATRVPSS